MSITITPSPSAIRAAREIREYLGYGYYSGVIKDFAAIIERELADAQEKIAELEQDKARLDWLAQRYVAAHHDRHFEARTADFGWSAERSTVSLRAAIDAARKEGQP
jgi:hypothetical protein